MELPEQKGTYILVASLAKEQRLEIGRLGRHDLRPGFYLYVGSALGSGGLRARLSHHLESSAEPHWHIDYLLRIATLEEIWFAMADTKLEHHWADLLEKAPQFQVPIARFGASDYHRSRASHLFSAKRRPSFAWFQQRLRSEFDASVRAVQYRVSLG